MVTASTGVQATEDTRQRGLADPPDRPWGQLQPAGAAGQEALAFQLLLDLLQGAQIVHGLTAQRPCDRVRVDVVEGRPGVVLRQGGRQLVELGQLLQRAGGIAEPERCVAGHRVAEPAASGLAPAEVRTGGPQRLLQPGQLGRHAHVRHGGRHEVGQFLALLWGQSRHQPRGGRGAARQRVDQLFQRLRVLREEVAERTHEVLESGVGVFATGVGLDHVVQRVQHVLHPGHVLGCGVLQCLLHAAELRVEHLAAQQVGNLLERLAGLRRTPLVVGQRVHGPSRVVRQ